MKTVQIRDAKSSFSAVIADAGRGRPTLSTRHHRPWAMAVPVSADERLFPIDQPNPADWLLAIPELPEPERNPAPAHTVDL